MFSPRLLWHQVFQLASLAIVPGALSAQATIRSWCYSDLEGPVVYFTQAFDTGVPSSALSTISTQRIASEYLEYLKGRYNYKTNSNYPIGCPVVRSPRSDDSLRRELTSRAEGAGKRVIELEWDFQPDPAAPAEAAAVAAAGHGGVRTPTPRADHGWCFSPGAGATVYAAGPFQAKGPIAMYEWNRGFGRFLAAKYSFQGGASCYVGGIAQAERWMTAYRQGARAEGRTIVETGWEYDVAQEANNQPVRPADPDDNPAPARPAPAAAASASTQLRQFATKEGLEARAYCRKDVMLAGALDCYRVQRAVYAYRVSHAGAGTPEPLPVLFSGDKLDCTACLDDNRMTMWARMQAQGHSLRPEIAKCVGHRFAVDFRTKPYPNRVKETYDAALAACKR